MKLKELLPLFVLDLANNHNGSVKHGWTIIKRVHYYTKDMPFRIGIKLQYRHLDTMIHPDFRDRTDLKYIKRFTETELKPEELKALKDLIAELGFVSVCTPYDEQSVDLAVEHGFDILKVASCSFTDWPLWERITETDKPIIASTAGATMDEIEKVVSFLAHRNKDFALMHCVAEYPTISEHLNLGRIAVLREKFPNIVIGYSTHEKPSNYEPVKIAMGLGARIFEKHVGLGKVNKYSATPSQVAGWLSSAQSALGVIEGKPDENEIRELRALRRGMFASKNIKKEQEIGPEDVFLALPTCECQFTANDMSKYARFTAKADITKGSHITNTNAVRTDSRAKVYGYIRQVRKLVDDSGVPVPSQVDVEVSHHYGIDRFLEFGCTIFTVINREYCKKLIVVLPGQKHPEQYHQEKEETFNVLYGDAQIYINGGLRRCKAGDVVVVERGSRHSFGTKNGCIIEEVSSTHYKDDSFYTDEAIMRNENRKTQLMYWRD